MKRLSVAEWRCLDELEGDDKEPTDRQVAELLCRKSLVERAGERYRLSGLGQLYLLRRKHFGE